MSESAIDPTATALRFGWARYQADPEVRASIDQLAVEWGVTPRKAADRYGTACVAAIADGATTAREVTALAAEKLGIDVGIHLTRADRRRMARVAGKHR